MSEVIVETDRLSRKFGTTQALDEVTLQVERAFAESTRIESHR